MTTLETNVTPFMAFTSMLMEANAPTMHGGDDPTDVGGFSAASDDAGNDPPVTEPLEKYRSKDLRKEVYRLKLRVVRKGPETNDHKNGYMALLRAYWREHAPSETAMVKEMPTPTTPMKTAFSWTGEPEPPHSQSQEAALSHLKQYTLASPPRCEMSSSLPPLPPLPLPTRGSSASPIPVPPPRTLYEYTSGERVGSPSSSMDLSEDRVVEASASQASEMNGYLLDASDDSDAMQDQPKLSTPTEAATIHETSTAASLCPIRNIPAVVEDDQFNSSLPESSTKIAKCPRDEDLDATMKRTHYWESRLTMSKRKMFELYGEMQVANQDEEIALLKDELAYYSRERKRAVRSLLTHSGSIN